MANWDRLSSVHAFAPLRQASASGTMWSMSRAFGSVNVLPSYWLYHWPEAGWQFEPVLTFVPSRLSTTSRVSQPLPCWIQCGKRSRL